MKELISRDDWGVFADMKSTVRVYSVDVARIFGKRHDHVMRTIDQIIQDASICNELSNVPKNGEISNDVICDTPEDTAALEAASAQFIKVNFKKTTYIDSRNRAQSAYAMTRDGFTLLVMRFTGKKALAFQIAYISRFNAMEAHAEELGLSRFEFRPLMGAIEKLHEDPQPYHYSNECNMIDQIVLGMTSKQFRELHNIPKGQSIRPAMTREELHAVYQLQHMDYGFVSIYPDYQERKEALIKFADREGYSHKARAVLPDTAKEAAAAVCGNPA